MPGATASQGGKQEGQPAGTKARVPVIRMPKCLAVSSSPVTLVSLWWQWESRRQLWRASGRQWELSGGTSPPTGKIAGNTKHQR